MISELFLHCALCTYAQQPKEGLYQSADGAYQFSLKNLNDSSIEVTETNMTSVYNKSGNAYQHSIPKYAQFMMRVNGPTEMVAFKTNTNQETKYTWIGSTTLSEEDCPFIFSAQKIRTEITRDDFGNGNVVSVETWEEINHNTEVYKVVTYNPSSNSTRIWAITTYKLVNGKKEG